MRVAPLPVGLPDLEQDAVDRRALAVEHPAFDADALADRVGVTRLPLISCCHG